MKKNKYVYNYKDITITVYACNKGWARYYVKQLYYYIDSLWYKFWDEYDNENSKVFGLLFEECHDAVIKIKSDDFVKAMKKLERLYKKIINTDKKVEEIMKMEVFKDE